jgi:hypothetical protein
MLRIWESEEDKAAPSVPEDKAKAAEGGKGVFPDRFGGKGDRVLPSDGTHMMYSSPNWARTTDRMIRTTLSEGGPGCNKEARARHTRRSISPGYRLWSAILEHEAGVCPSF